MVVYFVNVFLLWSLCVAHSSEVSQPVHFHAVELGDPATIECQIKSEMSKWVWYKFTTGMRLQLVAQINSFYNRIKLADEFHHRYSVKFDQMKNHLRISATTWEDVGTYFCGVMYLNSITFGSGTYLMVKGANMMNSVVQQPEVKSVQPGDSVTLNCTVHTGTCDGEHRVYWFRHSEESHPGLIYTHGGREDQCERKPEAQTHTCVYNLPIESLNASHAGTYYCAVASCGYIVFGNGTKLDFADEVNSSVLMDVMSGTLAFSTILSVLLALIVCIMTKGNCCCFKECLTRIPESSKTNVKDYRRGDSFHRIALKEMKINNSKSNDTWSECVYFSVKQ